MTDYSKRSDFEINRQVSLLLGIYGCDESGVVLTKSADIFNPCNSWADAGPIITENLIALKPVSLFVGGHRWFASKGEGDFGEKISDDNPLRAAMIVFLMMNEGE